MTTGSVAPLNAGCPCRPDPAELPVTLLSASVEDVSIEPTLMALTVDYETGRWRAEALARHILDWVLDFALRREERRPLAHGRALEIARKAMRATFGNGRDRGVPAEILLHAICRQFFGSDTVISKVWFKTAANDTYKGFDGVHCVHEGDTLQLWLGEAKFYRSIDSAIRSALNDLDEHFEQDYLRGEFALIADKIDDSHPHADELRTLMHPNTSLDAVFDRIVVPVLVAYDSSATIAHNFDCPEYRSTLEAEVRRAWMRFSSGFNVKLPITVRLFLVPMATKQALLEALDGELAKWL